MVWRILSQFTSKISNLLATWHKWIIRMQLLFNMILKCLALFSKKIFEDTCFALKINSRFFIVQYWWNYMNFLAVRKILQMCKLIFSCFDKIFQLITDRLESIWLFVLSSFFWSAMISYKITKSFLLKTSYVLDVIQWVKIW